jgi:hypothetical protein
MTSSTPRTSARGDLIAVASHIFGVASLSFSAGGFLMIGVDYLARGNGRAWACAGLTVFMMVGAFIVCRRAVLLSAAPKSS